MIYTSPVSLHLWGEIHPGSTYRALSRQRRCGRDVIQQHCSQAHRLNVKTTGVVSRVTLQTLFPQKPWYLVVTVAEREVSGDTIQVNGYIPCLTEL